MIFKKIIKTSVILLLTLFCLGYGLIYYTDNHKKHITYSKDDFKHYTTFSDLNTYKDASVKESDLENLYQKLENAGQQVALFKIKNGKVYVRYKMRPYLYRVFNVFEVLQKITKRSKLNDSTFLLFYADMIEEDSQKNLFFENNTPLFVFCRNVEWVAKHKLLLFPDDHVMGEWAKKKLYDSWPRLFQTIIRANKKYSWEKKANKAFWRGNWNFRDFEQVMSRCKGDEVCFNNAYSSSPRGKLVYVLKKEAPELLDVDFAAHKISQKHKVLANKYGLLMENFVPKEDQLKFKYSIVAESFASTPSFLWKLLSNSVVLKQDFPYEQWYHSTVVPNKHYVPVKEDWSDLIEKIKWLQNNDDKAHEIALNSTDFIQKQLSPERIDGYIASVLNEYSKKVLFDGQLRLKDYRDTTPFWYKKGLMFRGLKNFIYPLHLKNPIFDNLKR